MARAARAGQTPQEPEILGFVKSCSESPWLLKHLVSHRSVAQRLVRSLVEEVKQSGENGDLANTLRKIQARLTRLQDSKGKKRKSAEDPAWPQRFRRRLTYKQGAEQIWITKGIGCLGVNLMADIFSRVDLSTKLRAMPVSLGLREILQCRFAWDPLVVNQLECQGMLQSLKVHRTKCAFPQGISQASTLDLHLMDAEGSVHDQTDSEDDAERPTTAIGSPLGIVYLHGSVAFSFQTLSQVTIRNICNIDRPAIAYDLLLLRCRCLASFGFVKVEHHGNGVYRLEAAKREPPFVDCTVVSGMNSERIPQTARVEATSISESEALFLLEHPTAYKNGRFIRFVHSTGIVPDGIVRRMYKKVLASLKESYPSSFRQSVRP